MTEKRTGETFRTVGEYRAFYSAEAAKETANRSRYYRIGADVARMACEKATNSSPAVRSLHAEGEPEVVGGETEA